MKDKTMNIMKIIYIISLLFFIFVIIYSISLNERHYVFDSVLFMIFASLFYFYQKKLNLTVFTYALIIIGMALHDFGRFGFYSQQFFGINWDIYTHVIGNIGIAMLVYFALKTRVNLKEKGFFKYFLLFVFLISLAIALIGEFNEFGGTLFLKDGQGLLGIEGEAGPYENVSIDYWDTMTDLLANALGSIIGIAMCCLFYRKT